MQMHAQAHCTERSTRQPLKLECSESRLTLLSHHHTDIHWQQTGSLLTLLSHHHTDIHLQQTGSLLTLLSHHHTDIHLQQTGSLLTLLSHHHTDIHLQQTGSLLLLLTPLLFSLLFLDLRDCDVQVSVWSFSCVTNRHHLSTYAKMLTS